MERENSAKMEVIQKLQTQLIDASMERDSFLEQLMETKRQIAEGLDENTQLNNEIYEQKRLLQEEREKLEAEKEEFRSSADL